jgi:hypothetical protein
MWLSIDQSTYIPIINNISQKITFNINAATVISFTEAISKINPTATNLKTTSGDVYFMVRNATSEDKLTKKEYKVLIIDSEGIGAFNEDENHDTRIFLLALLLSSYFIYNSMGTIDENALQNLSLIVNLSKQLEVKGMKAED